MGKRNQARNKGQARKAKRGGGGGGNRGGNRAAATSAKKSGGNNNNAAMKGNGGGGGGNKPRTAGELRARIKERKADGQNTSRAQAKLDAIVKDRRRQGNKSHKSQGEIKQVSDFDFSKRGKDTVEKGELRHLRKQGLSRDEISEYVNESGLRVRKGAQRKMDKWASAKQRAEQREKDKETETNTDTETETGAGTTTQTETNNNDNANVSQEPTTIPVPKPITVNPAEDILNGNTTTVDQVQDQEVSQDNDINSTVTGDNNNVNISQDNSVRQYGGINKSFVYNGSSNGKNYLDTPVSAATMAGYYHDEDTPASSASFVDRYTTMNSDYQKRFQNTNFAQQAITKAAQSQAVDIGALDERVDERAKANRARSSSMAGDIFGDMFNYKPEDYESGS